MRAFTLSALLLGITSQAWAQSVAPATLLRDWERNRKNVLDYLAAMPDSAVGFRPTPGVRTFAEQFDHIVTTNLEVAATALRGLDRPPAIADSAQYLHSKSALRAYAESTFVYVLGSLKAASPASLGRSVQMYGQPAQPAARWLELSLEHSVWTLGQVVPYLRLNQVTPPAYDIPF